MNKSFNVSGYGNLFICCKDCEKRSALCHDYCGEYQTARVKMQEIKKKIELQKSILTKREEKNIERYRKRIR